MRHILELYPDGPGILNELIQNADDARASEVGKQSLYHASHHDESRALSVMRAHVVARRAAYRMQTYTAACTHARTCIHAHTHTHMQA